MSEIRLISARTDISQLHMRKVGWDVVICGRPFQVVDIEGYVHTIGGRWGDNSYWAYPLDEAPTYENLVEFCADDPICWGITYAPRLYIKGKWDESKARRTEGIMITRNGELFSDAHSLIDALQKIEQYREHPMSLDERGYAEKVIGRKVWWRSQPAVITRFIKGQACVILEPDGISKFAVPPEFADDPPYYEDNDIKTSITDGHIWWFREE